MSLLPLHVNLSDIAAAALLLFLSTAAVRYLTSKSPMVWPIFGILPTILLHLPNIYDWATSALTNTGGTFSFNGPWFSGYFGIMTADPANIEYMLKTHFSNFPKGAYYHDRFSDFLGDGIFNADGTSWRDQRRAANAEMQSSRFSYEALRRLVHTKLLPLVESLDGTTVDLQDIFLRFTFDNICAAAFGVDTGCLSIELPTVPFAEAFEQATELSLRRFITPSFIWKPMRRFQLGREKSLAAAIKEVHEFAEKTVSDRRAEIDKLYSHTEKRSDHLLSQLMENQVDGVQFSDGFLKDFCISVILAGRDTSSVALAWFFWLLDMHPRVEQLIVDEISNVMKKRGGKEEDDQIESPFTLEELKEMDYLQAALSESLRLYPPLPVDFKEVLEDDVFPDGTRARKGSRVFYMIYSMGRMEGIWGKDCREFRPERWLSEDGVFAAESQFKYAVFNGGPRLCVGKKFAYMQMKMVAASIMIRYRVVPVPEQEVVPKLTATLYMKNGLLVSFKPRKSSVSS